MHSSPFVLDRRTFLKVVGAAGGATAIGALTGALEAREAFGQSATTGADTIAALAESLAYDRERIAGGCRAGSVPVQLPVVP